MTLLSLSAIESTPVKQRPSAFVFLSSNRRNILADKVTVSHDQAVDKATKEYEIFRVRQDREYISDFDRETEKIFERRIIQLK